MKHIGYLLTGTLTVLLFVGLSPLWALLLCVVLLVGMLYALGEEMVRLWRDR